MKPIPGLKSQLNGAYEYNVITKLSEKHKLRPLEDVDNSSILVPQHTTVFATNIYFNGRIKRVLNTLDLYS